MAGMWRGSGVAASTLVATLLCAATAWAQIVQGTVRSGGAPLVGATVY